MDVNKCKTCNYCSNATRKGNVVLSHRYDCLLCGASSCKDVSSERCRYSKKDDIINSKMFSDRRLHKI